MANTRLWPTSSTTFTSSGMLPVFYVASQTLCPSLKRSEAPICCHTILSFLAKKPLLPLLPDENRYPRATTASGGDKAGDNRACKALLQRRSYTCGQVGSYNSRHANSTRLCRARLRRRAGQDHRRLP